jgi:hypothetical protein
MYTKELAKKLDSVIELDCCNHWDKEYPHVYAMDSNGKMLLVRGAGEIEVDGKRRYVLVLDTE